MPGQLEKGQQPMYSKASESIKSSAVKKNSVSSVRRHLAADIRRYLQKHTDRKVTIRELSETFHVSETHIKTTFRAVYGDSLHSWFRHEKMLAAAKLLEETDLTVLEIAGKVGFDNGSKFAAAFQAELGMSPSGYRYSAKERSVSFVEELAKANKNLPKN